jgi:hypothetical protein
MILNKAYVQASVKQPFSKSLITKSATGQTSGAFGISGPLYADL